jgi:succinate dehydrogenase / fumarate reductase cytochrome b subunit
MAAQQRPLSPHLDVYKWQLTAVLSILHRATGVLLAIGAFVLAGWLLSVAGDESSFDMFNDLAASMIGQIVLVAITASLVYHLLNGIRHLLWDIGWGFELPQVYASGWTVVGLTVVITAALAYLGLNAGGVA